MPLSPQLSRPGQVKWRLMIASCHRRTGNYQKALETYKRIHELFPDNIECEGVEKIFVRGCRRTHNCPHLGLKYLVRICSDMKLPEVQEYTLALRKAEQSNERRESVSE